MPEEGTETEKDQTKEQRVKKISVTNTECNENDLCVKDRKQRSVKNTRKTVNEKAALFHEKCVLVSCHDYGYTNNGNSKKRLRKCSKQS